MHRDLTFEDQVFRIEEILREYRSDDPDYRYELLGLIYSAF